MTKKNQKQETESEKKNKLVSAGTERITLQHEFTKDELEKKGADLAQACSRREQLEDQKKQINSEFKLKLDSANAEINLLAQHISQKFEMQNVEAEVTLDFEDKKRIYTQEGVEIYRETLRGADFNFPFCTKP